MGNIGGALPEGAPYQPWAADLVKKRMADNSKDNPDANCLPLGIAQMNAHPYPRKIIQTPTEVILIYEGSGTTVREVYLDGRTLPKDPEPWYNGYSVGHWEGDTLVIDTVNFNGRTRLDTVGHPHSDQLHLVQRFSRPDRGHIAHEMIIEDPKAFTKPWKTTRTLTLRTDWEMMEYSCEENNKSLWEGRIKVPKYKDD